MSSATAATFGELLRQHRIAANLTQEALAERSGLSVHGVQKLERGVTRPYRDTVERLLLALPVSAADQAAFRAAGGPAPRQRATDISDTVPHNLHFPVTSFIGREQDLVEVSARLHGTRVLTLTGVGGCGKTRLALELARAVLERYPDGAWMVELGPLNDPDLVAHTVASVMGVHVAGQSATTALTIALRTRRLLLVLDNCEHLLDACARLVDAVVQVCPDVRVLATSREPLGIGGEVAWRVPSLATPDPEQLLSLAELEHNAAVRLFVERASAVEPHFALTPRNARAVVQVCRRLDGIPLALELAASRVRALTVEQLLARLDQRFRLLTGGSRTAVPRQRTLQATLDWSYDLLDECEQALFRRLAVFAGGWTLEAAEAIGQGQPIEANDVLDVLTSLVDKSLVFTDARGREERYSMLETIRQYAEDRLLQSGDAVMARDRHRDWYLELARAEAQVRISENDRLIGELDNFRAALTWCASDDAQATVGLRLVGSLGLRWNMLGGGMVDGRRWLETFLDKAPAPTVSRADALLTLDHTLRVLHEFDLAYRAAEEALAIYREYGDEPGIADAMAHLGLVAANRGDYALGIQLLEKALAATRAGSNHAMAVRRLREMGVVYIVAGDFQRARAMLTESSHLATSALAKDSDELSMTLYRLAILDRLDGDHTRARARLAEISPNALARINPMKTYYPLEMANLARAEGRFDAARTGIMDVLRRLQPAAEFGLFDAIATLGICEIAAGVHARGVCLLAGASNVEGPIGTLHFPSARIEVPLYLQRAFGALGEKAYGEAWARGVAMTPNQLLEGLLAEQQR